MLYAIVAVLALIVDQAVKYWTTVNLVEVSGTAKLIPGLIHLTNLHNTGAAFSFLEGARWFFVVLCILFVLVVVYALAKNLITQPVCRWAAVMVVAGAIGNCIDRIVCGYVVDMLEFDFLFFKHPFPVFNIADIYITLGVIVFCVALLLEKPSEKKNAGAAKAAPGEPQAAPKAVRKSPFRRRHKIEIPTFEKHELPEVPAMDPNDPFAEWEKQAKAPSPAAPKAPPAQHMVYSQPSESQPTAPAPAPEQPAAPPAPQPPVRPAAPAAPAAPKPAEKPAADEFDLDSILAEFKDQ